MGSCVPANEVHELNFAQLERTGYPEKEIQSHYLEPVILEPYSYLLLIRLAAKRHQSHYRYLPQ